MRLVVGFRVERPTIRSGVYAVWGTGMRTYYLRVMGHREDGYEGLVNWLWCITGWGSEVLGCAYAVMSCWTDESGTRECVCGYGVYREELGMRGCICSYGA